MSNSKVLHARSLGLLEKTQAFGMTPVVGESDMLTPSLESLVML